MKGEQVERRLAEEFTSNERIMLTIVAVMLATLQICGAERVQLPRTPPKSWAFEVRQLTSASSRPILLVRHFPIIERRPPR